jgi:hypothetical protein
MLLIPRGVSDEAGRKMKHRREIRCGNRKKERTFDVFAREKERDARKIKEAPINLLMIISTQFN